MALTDDEKTALEWATLLPGALRVLGDLADSDDVRAAADVIGRLPIGTLASELSKLRTDVVDVAKGSMTIEGGVEVEVLDGGG